jgi:D-alanyl-lipoteichoic acid acyltransferase DltB (MBOAT superfamily)
MNFVSLQWMGWIIGITLLYWLVPSRGRGNVLALATAAFLLVADPLSTALLLALSGVTYAGSRGVKRPGIRIWAAILVVAGILAYWKVRVSSAPLDVIRDVAMPLGLSYYSFRMVHYVIESARGSLEPHSYADYLRYLLFLPTIVVGPIHRFPAFLKEREVRWRADQAYEGLERILFGYFKLTVLGNYLLASLAARRIGALGADHPSLTLYLEAVRGSLNLYMQFSGYSDIAIGFSLLLGHRIIENFDWPFLKTSIADFWRCWHISLTSWSRDYVYMPVVGATRQPVYGTIASLLLVGIWHELSVRYVLWGAYHGCGIVAVNQFRKSLRRRKIGPVVHPVGKRLLRAISIFATFNYFVLGYVIISQKSIGDILGVYRKMFLGSW